MLEIKDRRILDELQRNGRLTMQELGERVGMSSSACWRRVKSLEETGIVDRYAVIVNARKAGFGLSSVVHVSLARHEQENVDRFIREVRRHPEILECFATSGEADFHLRVVVEDIDAYNTFLDDGSDKRPGYCTDAQCSSVATIVRTSYWATTSLSWLVTSVSHRTSP